MYGRDSRNQLKLNNGDGRQVQAGVPGKQTLTAGLAVAANRAPGSVQRKPSGAESQSGGAIQAPPSAQAPAIVQRQEASATAAVARSRPALPSTGDAARPGASEAHYEQVQEIIEQLLREFRSCPITAPVGAPPAPADPDEEQAAPSTVDIAIEIPYWNNDYSRFDQREAAQQGAAYPYPTPSPAYRAANGDQGQNAYRDGELGQYDTATESTGTVARELAVAKGTPEEIRAFVQDAVDHGVVDPPAVEGDDPAVWGPAWKAAIEQWMQTTGIGVDCNGLVYQALLLVQQSTGAPTTREAGGRVSALDYYGDHRTLATVDHLGSLGDTIEPLELQPGDVMQIPDHVRIVMRVDARDPASRRIEFTTAESTVDGRTEPVTTYEGPRAHGWRWEDGELSHRYEDSTEWLPSNETPNYRRHLLPPDQGELPEERPEERPVQQVPAGPSAAGAATEPAPAVHAAATRGIAGSSHALPHADTIQPLFGSHDLGKIQAHTDESAAAGARAMGAQAFAAGDHVAFASTPDLHTAAHEAAHVVQQRAGVHLDHDVGQAGDPYERNADEVADRVVQGRSAEDLLPASAQLGAGASQRGVQRQGGEPEMTPAQVEAALEWATRSGIGAEAIREVQRVCGIEQTGVYDEATARAVFAKQHELRIGPDGRADHDFCQRVGLIFTETITAATVTDPVLRQVASRFPDGVTVAIYPAYDLTTTGDGLEFLRQANTFAANQQAVGVSTGGAVALGVSCAIAELGDIIEVVQSIHRGLAQKWAESQPAAAGEDASAAEPPAYTRVRNLALFSHGLPWGMGLNEDNNFSHGGLHVDTPESPRPSNIEAFVRGLSDAVVPDVRVQLFGCDAGQGTDLDGNPRKNYAESLLQDQGDRAGVGSLAASMAEAFGEDATVLAHTTFGHTTENHSARVFGAEAGGGEGGIPLFDLMYPEMYIQSELERLFPDLTDEERAARHDSLREQMWTHYMDSIHYEHFREETRSELPLGQETFIEPAPARALLHADWEATWIPEHLDEVQPR
jgi:hypothetical protein